MKKSTLILAALFASMAVSAVEPLKVATFEDVNIPDTESALHLVLTDYIQSGSFLFQQEVSISEYGTYYYGNLPTNKSDNTYASYLDAEKSASGGAYEGSNFVVWTASYMGLDSIALDHADVVPGFFINNTAYAVNSMLNGDAYAKKFGKDDWFRLTIKGYLNGVAVNNEVKVDLAADGKYINQWTYVDLSVLGEVDAIKFSMWSSDVVTYDEGVTYYMNTPAYFAMDNFGAEMPAGYVAPEMAEFPEEQGIEDTEAAVKAVKVLRDGQIVIVRGEVEYTVTGLRVK